MQDIDQNMDELFRKAADHYPLKADDSRWDDIAPRLTQKPNTKWTAKKTGLKKYTGLLLLLLFVSLLLAGGLITSSLKKNNSSKFLPVSEEKRSAIPLPDNERRSFVPGINANTGSEEINIQFSRSVNNNRPIVIKNPVTLKNTNGSAARAGETHHLSAKVFLYREILMDKATNLYDDIHSKADEEKLQAVSQITQKKLFTPSTEKEADENSIFQKGIFQQRSFYIGAASGLLFDEVKNQGLKKTGFSIGLIAGYRFKNHLSIETGFLFAKKPYFSTGKYFSMDKISNSMPAGMEILSLEGKNNVLEIPVRIKYDFLHRSKHYFFSSAGISSYIVTHEKNNYLTAMNGVQQTMISSYKNRSRSAAATLDFSAGYEYAISKTKTIRIEPYIQIPLRGMGVGSMPMKSSGIRLGITKFFN